MRVSHLFESTDFKPLTKIWQGDSLNRVIDSLKSMPEDEQMLGDILDRARSRSAEAAPEQLFNFVKPLIDAAKHTDEHGFANLVVGLLNTVVSTVLKMDLAALKLLASKVELKTLANMIDRELSVKLRLAEWKLTRTQDQEKFDDDNQLYVFVGRPTFKEVPPGSDNFKKTLEIERLVPVDRFDQKAHQMVAMMKMRATYQGENSDVYMVTLPKMALDDHDDVPEWLIPLIDQHKKRITN